MGNKQKIGLLAVLVLLVVVAGATVVARNQSANQGRTSNAPSNATETRLAQADDDAAEPDAPRKLDVPYVPTPEKVVERMLALADIKKDDVVYDLGCGDGRIVITAAKKYGVRGVGIDIDPQRIAESKENAKKAGVTDRVKFFQRDLFKTEIKDASVMMLYLLPEINLRLRPKLFAELKPGARIVSHSFDMGDWKPDQTVQVPSDGYDRTVHYWVLPAHVGGTWQWTAWGANGEQRGTLQLTQKFQEVSGTLNAGGANTLRDVKLVGDRFSFAVLGARPATFNGRVNGNTLEGTWKDANGERKVIATRDGANLPPIEGNATNTPANKVL